MGISIQKLESGHEDESLIGWASGPNSFGGVSVKIAFTNTSDKAIKYVTFGVVPYNAVNDRVCCTISEKSETFLKFTGPLAGKAHSRSHMWEDVWWNNSITSVRLSQVRIEYMDGTTESFKGSEVPFNSSGGCYVATAVYGSYDCPQVWTLRRYRDDTLTSTWHGRAFIRTYYAISPTLVKWFGDTQWFKKMWKGKLDRMVERLNAEGVSNMPYQDKDY